MIPRCPKCGSDQLMARGSKARPNRYQCTQCTKYFTDTGSPKVLVFDIETLPCIGNFWGTGKEYISYEHILEDWVVLSWSAKALFEPHIISDILTPTECRRRVNSIFNPDAEYHNADYRIVKRMWKLLDEADVVITQNGKKFDVRKLNARFLLYGFPPPHPFHHIDTLEACNAAFSTSSARLGYMMEFLGLARKMDTNFKLWKRCQMGDEKALQEMYQYGLNDTLILEDYYARIRAWIPNHPNFSVYTHKYADLDAGEIVCPVCRNVLPETCFDGYYRTPLGNEYDSFRCGHCGAVGRKSRKNPGTPKVRKAG